MTPADKRVMDLLDRWLTSIELHMKYADLDDVTYQQMQPWPRHERPARWILELAQQKVLSLQSLCKAHRTHNDPSLAESLELMCFLANLVGAQHIQRFIPLALPEREAKADTGIHRAISVASTPSSPRTITSVASVPTLSSISNPAPALRTVPTAAPPSFALAATTSTTSAPAQVASIPRPASAPVIPIPSIQSKPPEETEKTREMPRLRPARQRHSQTNKSSEPRHLHAKGASIAAKSKPLADNTQLDDVVVADAVRLLRWGRQWHEIAELIARIAERPNIAEVRKILRSHKPAIEQQLEA